MREPGIGGPECLNFSQHEVLADPIGFGGSRYRIPRQARHSVPVLRTLYCTSANLESPHPNGPLSGTPPSAQQPKKFIRKLPSLEPAFFHPAFSHLLPTRQFFFLVSLIHPRDSYSISSVSILIHFNTIITSIPRYGMLSQCPFHPRPHHHELELCGRHNSLWFC